MGVSKEVKELRTQQINDFMSQFSNLTIVDVDVIKEGLRKILGEIPGVDFEYGVDISLNETTQEKKRTEKLNKIHIYYTYYDEYNTIKSSKISYLVD